MGHCCEHPHHRILSRLIKSSPDTGFFSLANGVESHTADSQIALFLGQPLSVVGEIGQQEEADDGNHKSDSTLEDKQPFPSTEATNVSKSVEDTGGDETGKGRGKNTVMY